MLSEIVRLQQEWLIKLKPIFQLELSAICPTFGWTRKKVNAYLSVTKWRVPHGVVSVWIHCRYFIFTVNDSHFKRFTAWFNFLSWLSFFEFLVKSVWVLHNRTNCLYFMSLALWLQPCQRRRCHKGRHFGVFNTAITAPPTEIIGWHLCQKGSRIEALNMRTLPQYLRSIKLSSFASRILASIDGINGFHHTAPKQ